MPHVEQSIDIHTPPENVFGIVAHQPERMPEWWTAFDLQQRVSPPPTAVGSISRYVYNMMGIRIKGEHQVMQLEQDRRLVVKTISGIDSMFEFNFAAIDGGTRLSVRIAYSLPGSVLGQLLNRLTIEQRNERDLIEALQRLKALAEASG
ncbi:MAG: SRPBCC family protein [Anaerolinea sp.]|nr:SRPBCC family protein [Anaerolinea sp.]